MARLAVVFAGDLRDPRSWSGVPKNLADSFEAVGHDVIRVSARPPRWVARLLKRGHVPHPERCSVNTVGARTGLAIAGRLDGVVQIGTEFTLRTDIPTATFEDMTVIQHERYNDAWFMGFSARSRRTWKARQLESYANATACCMFSKWGARSIIEDYGIAPDKVHVVGIGGNHLIDPPAARDWSTPHFFIMAGDWRRKNVPAVIDAFRIIRTDHPDATLDVVGPYPGKGGAGIVLHGSLSLGIPSQRRQVETLFRNSTCYVMPSTHESGGTVYIEAATAGLPSIAGSIGGCTEFVGDGGIVVDPHDFDQLVAAMRRLCDEETATTLAARALRHVQWYQWPKVARRVAHALGLSAS